MYDEAVLAEIAVLGDAIAAANSTDCDTLTIAEIDDVLRVERSSE
ncbi:MAG: hypothetical protein ACYCO3_08430 [Mycobacteriales bacterium]